MKDKKIVLIEGARTPFLRSGTDYMDLMSYQLGQSSIEGLLRKTGLDPKEVGSVTMGTVIPNIKTGNVARESALTAGIPFTTPAHTVTQACISANRAICSGIENILRGEVEVAIAGGVDLTSDAPILFPRKMRKKLFEAQKLRGFGDYLKFVLSLRFSDFVPERPVIAEFLTNRVMGEDSDLMSARFSISRREQDEYAMRSHHLAAKAEKEGHLQKEVCSVTLPNSDRQVQEDNGIRANTTIEKLTKLKPAFVKPDGTHTAGNSSYLTDGGAAVLLMTEEKAKALGLKPKAEVIDYVFVGQDIETELLLGPTYAVSKLLAKTGFELADIDVFEFHEAFAGQILTNLKCIASDDFAKEKLGRSKAIGEIPMDKFNLWGGSLSLGHPFGATGARLVNTGANRLTHENGEIALVAACAAGGLGHAMLLRRV